MAVAPSGRALKTDPTGLEYYPTHATVEANIATLVDTYATNVLLEESMYRWATEAVTLYALEGIGSNHLLESLNPSHFGPAALGEPSADHTAVLLFQTLLGSRTRIGSKVVDEDVDGGVLAEELKAPVVKDTLRCVAISIFMHSQRPPRVHTAEELAASEELRDAYAYYDGQTHDERTVAHTVVLIQTPEGTSYMVQSFGELFFDQIVRDREGIAARLKEDPIGPYSRDGITALFFTTLGNPDATREMRERSFRRHFALEGGVELDAFTRVYLSTLRFEMDARYRYTSVVIVQ